ncbi:MAG: response regulator [Myxococcota bacterium]
MASDTINRSGVLIVEPSKSMTKLLRSACEHRGLTVRTTDSASDAIALIAKQPPHVLVTAGSLRDIDGFGLGAAIKATESLRETPVILVSANAHMYDSSIPLGPDIILPKCGEELLRRLTDFMDLRRLGDGPAWEEDRTLSGRVLIADDDRLQRRIMGRILEGAGLDIIVVDDGRQAVRAVSKNEFDLIFLDIEMPELDGWEAIAQIRSHRVATPAVAVTGHWSVSVLIRGHEMGFDSVVGKPVNRDSILTRCSHLLPDLNGA